MFDMVLNFPISFGRHSAHHIRSYQQTEPEFFRVVIVKAAMDRTSLTASLVRMPRLEILGSLSRTRGFATAWTRADLFCRDSPSERRA